LSTQNTLSSQLSQTFQQMSQDFTTFFYNATSRKLSPVVTLVSDAQVGLELSDVTSISPSFAGSAVQIAGKVHGWPKGLCKNAQWNGGVTDTTHFKFGSLYLQSETALDAAGFPVCDFTYSLTVNAAAPLGSYDPGLTITLTKDNTVDFNLPLPATSQAAVVNTPTLAFEKAVFSARTAATTQPPTAVVPLLWKANGRLTLAPGWVPTSYDISAIPTLSCLYADNTKADDVVLSLQKVFDSDPLPGILAGAVTPNLSSTDRFQTFALGVAGGDPTIYNIYAPAGLMVPCTISGNIQMKLADSATGISNLSLVAFSVKLPFQPKRGAITINHMACIPTLNSNAELSLAAAAAGEKCTVSGSDPDLATAVSWRGPVNEYRFALTPGSDSSSASFAMSVADVAKLTAGAAYNIAPSDPAGNLGVSKVKQSVIP
jgi:hypothetical protein